MEDESHDLKPRTLSFARRIIKLYTALPKATLAQTLGKQLLRSGTSVGANYREAYRARSRKEFVALMGICLKELDETDYWLELLHEEKILPANRLKSIRQETKELTAIFVTIINQTKKKNS